MRFENREQAGELLAQELKNKVGRRGVLVVAIPRGGVVVGEMISRLLKIPLVAVITKKIGAPGNEELAVGAIAENGKAHYEGGKMERLPRESRYLEEKEVEVRRKIAEYVVKFRRGKELEVAGKEVILVDDGVATGLTVEVAIGWLKDKGSEKITLAVPVGAKDSIVRLEKMVVRVVCLSKAEGFSAVGEFYRDFEQVSDERVVKLLGW